MGITKFSVVQRYINFSKTEKVEQFERATMNISKLNLQSVNEHSASESAELINHLMALAPRGKEQAWSAFIQGLKALFAEEETESPVEPETIAP